MSFLKAPPALLSPAYNQSLITLTPISQHQLLICYTGYFPLSLYALLLASAGSLGCCPCSSFHGHLRPFSHLLNHQVEDPCPGVNSRSNAKSPYCELASSSCRSSPSSNVNCKKQIWLDTYLSCCGAVASLPHLASIRVSSASVPLSLFTRSLPSCKTVAASPPCLYLRLGSHIVSLSHLTLVLLP